MSYTVIDLVDKAIYSVEKKKKMYQDHITTIAQNTKNYVLINVIVKNLDKTIEYYKMLKTEAFNVESEEIDFVVYDKIAFLINEFNQKAVIFYEGDNKSIMESYLNFEKDVLALYIDIQGRLVKNERDVNTKAYQTICKMIREKEKTIKSLEQKR